MGRMNWRVLRIHDDAKMPTNENGSAGFDIYCVRDDDFKTGIRPGCQSIVLQPGESHLFHTGIKCSFSQDHVALLWDRSSLGCKGIHRLAGVIDASYRGEWMVQLTNLGKDFYIIEEGDKIIQVIFQELPFINFGEVYHESSLGYTNRGDKGFGSTGV